MAAGISEWVFYSTTSAGCAHVASQCLSSRARRQRIRKTLHICIQTGIVVMAFVGLAAITFYKKQTPGMSGLPPPSGTATVRFWQG